MTLSGNFESLSHWTTIKLYSEVNMLMENWFSKLASKYILAWLKNQKFVKKGKMQNFEKIQKWIVEKRLISGKWNFSCRYMLRSSPCMQNLLIVRFIVWQIWPKNQILSIFWAFFDVFRPKNLFNIWFMGWNFAWRCPWCLSTCMQNLGPLALSVWS